MQFTCTQGSRAAFAKDPAVIRFGGCYYLYFSSYQKKDGREPLVVGIARSKDMETWEFVDFLPLTQECEQQGIGAPAAYVENGKVYVKCSPAESIAMITGRIQSSVAFATEDNLVTEASFDLCEEQKYLRIVVTDAKGRKAHSQVYYVDDWKECL